MTALLIILMERMTIIATTAFLLSQTKLFQRLIKERSDFHDNIKLACLFGLLGIIGTYTGIPVQDALANSRAIGVIIAGLLGGPIVGAMAGSIAGLHRYFLGGFTASSCAIASVTEGILSGLVSHFYKERPIPWYIALLTGLTGEIIHMTSLLIISRPFDATFSLVSTIGLPMIIVNSIGITVFMSIITIADEQHKRIGAVQAQKALDIASKTLPFLRQNLTIFSAEATISIIYRMNDYSAVAITDTERILAHVGEGSDHHKPGLTKLTTLTQKALKTGTIQIAESAKEIGCNNPSCNLGSAIIVPLHKGNQIVGTIKLYHSIKNTISPLDLQLASGLAHLFSTQLELAEVDRQAKLAARAELRALQAQINPHFLFNTLNTISSLVRTQPEVARDIIVKLSTLFRHSLHQTERQISLAEELTHVDAYLDIEQIRFGEKLKIIRNIDPQILDTQIPSYTLQPLIENATKHGIQPKEDGGTITIEIMKTDSAIAINIIDDGVGIPKLELQNLCTAGFRSGKSSGIGLYNVSERLKSIYGKPYGLSITSQLDKGTTVSIKIPLHSIEDAER